MNDEPTNLSDLAQAFIDTTPDSRLRDHCIDAQAAIDEFTAGHMEGWTLGEVRVQNILRTMWRVILTQHQRIQALEVSRSGGEGGV